MRSPILNETGILGNYTPTQTTSTGSGRSAIKTPFNRVMVAGKTGDVVRIPASDLYPSPGCAGLKFYAQAVGGGATVKQTLAPPELALDPEQDATVWADSNTLAAGSIVQLKVDAATAFRIEFTSNCIVYLVGS